MTDDLKARVAQQRAPQTNDQAPAAAPGKELNPVDVKVATARGLLNQMKGEFATALPTHLGADRFIRMALTCVRKTPTLLDCDSASVIAALMEAARLGLEPGTKQCAIVPFNGKAVFMAQWQGLVELMYRSGQIGSVTAEFIHENDQWEYTIGDGGGFYHRPDILSANRGPIILAYAFANLKDGSRSRLIILNRRDAEEIRDTYSKNYLNAERNRRGDPDHFRKNPTWGKYNSTWHTDFDAMWRKSCVRRLADWVPSSPELRELMARETDAGEMNPLAEVIVPGDEVIDGDVIDDDAQTDGEVPAEARSDG